VPGRGAEAAAAGEVEREVEWEREDVVSMAARMIVEQGVVGEKEARRSVCDNGVVSLQREWSERCGQCREVLSGVLDVMACDAACFDSNFEAGRRWAVMSKQLDSLCAVLATGERRARWSASAVSA